MTSAATVAFIGSGQLVVYDLVSRGRVHSATLWGGAIIVGFEPLLYYVLSRTQAWLSLADALRG
jgi:hypothetical protein